MSTVEDVLEVEIGAVSVACGIGMLEINVGFAASISGESERPSEGALVLAPSQQAQCQQRWVPVLVIRWVRGGHELRPEEVRMGAQAENLAVQAGGGDG